MMTATAPHILRVIRPEGEALPLVFDSPHSGREYPADFHHACSRDALMRAEDNMVDDLFACVPRYGASYLCAQFPRTYIDVNRRDNDVDPELIEGRLPARYAPSSRSHAGIGLIRRIVRPGVAVYGRKLALSEIEKRIEHYYLPYHEALKGLIDEAHYAFGQVWHINCHSMPSNIGQAGGVQADFVLGDRDGTTCDLEFTRALRDFIKDIGYRVAVNNPYKGVEILRRYGRPRTGHNSLQIEINKALYWNEFKAKPNKGYDVLKADIEKIAAFTADYARANLTSMAAD